jgi:hypothetical protein
MERSAKHLSAQGRTILVPKQAIEGDDAAVLSDLVGSRQGRGERSALVWTLDFGEGRWFGLQ